LLSEITTTHDETHARHLMGMVDQVLALAGIGLDAIDGFAVTRGPGSFTGLRIGLSSIKGLGMATGKPVVPVSSLETLAVQAAPASGTSGTIVALIDAYRREVFLGGYQFKDGRMTAVIPETVIAPEKVVDVISDVSDSAMLVGSGVVTYRRKFTATPGATIRFSPNINHTIRAATVGRIGLNRLDSDGINAIDIRPVYLRKSDAQIHLLSPAS
jgi:tRNA threonylcarbamoyladenosine biosynthesis protein TsaB